MTPDQRRWLERAKKLAADVRTEFEELEPAEDLVLALIRHIKTLPGSPEWHVNTLDALFRDMLPLADCCASLEARLPDGGQGGAQLAWKHLLLAAHVSTVSRQLLLVLECRFRSGYSNPPPALTTRLALSASLVVRWWPKALRAAAERELGQATQLSSSPALQATSTCRPNLLHMAAEAASATINLQDLILHGSPHIDAVRSTLCSPATLTATLGNLSAVYARFTSVPATFKDQALQWDSLPMLAGRLLAFPLNEAVAAAVEQDADVRQQLAAALLPYAAHLLEVADLRRASWFDAWGELVPALASHVAWPNPEAGVAGGPAQHSAVVLEGLLRLLHTLPPLGKPPSAYRTAREWFPIPLYTAKAAAVAATKALRILDRLPQAQVLRVAALREVQQRGLSSLLALMPIMTELLIAAAGVLGSATVKAGIVEGFFGRTLHAYGGTLDQLLVLGPAADEILNNKQLQGLQAQPGELAAAAEAALRLAAQSAVFAQTVDSGSHPMQGLIHRFAMGMAERILHHVRPTAKREVSAAPEPGRVRPSLKTQLAFVNTACKFAVTALTPGAAASGGGRGGRGEVSAGELRPFVQLLLEESSSLLASHVHAEDIPHGRAPLAPKEKSALIGSALALSAASSAVVRLLPEGRAREAHQTSHLLLLCRFLVEPDLADALLAQHAELAEQLVGGLEAAAKDATDTQATEALDLPLDTCSWRLGQVVQANRRLGPVMLGGAAGEALKAAVQQSLLGGSQHEAALAVDLLVTLAAAAQGCFEGRGQAAAAQLRTLLQTATGVRQLSRGGWEALHAVQAAADEWLAQQAQQQWRQEQLLLCALATGTRACANLACTNLGGASEAGIKAKRCSGCRCVQYCSTACQRTDWAAWHKAMCKQLQARQAAGE